jgi:hypothetical protein
MQQLVDQENKKEDQTPSKVTKLGNSFPNISLEELALQTKSVTRLTTNFGIDDSWGFLCGTCGQKLSEKLSKI